MDLSAWPHPLNLPLRILPTLDSQLGLRAEALAPIQGAGCQMAQTVHSVAHSNFKEAQIDGWLA
eukprot:636652-Lingulodinium_polyedra.AAC.1